ncbi:four helix bundle protein [Tenacibaculum sp. SZ-18]|jgi:four helix bundle protein|uniref:four helix bundle protein n=1 Tax=Tenacibaculum sp. SZ-18 TaxID=754423 RepID=UPI000C2D56B9|nr:four helix bundle protein [Tenacibaculum sp. SZ-18]AUC15017.1 four helix bundle protein [Tenacibaculum sp. SZ-18]
MNNYENLKIWEKAMNLVEEVYSVIKLMPEEEKYGLVSQIKRCSISIPSNIAEGAGRNSKKEFKHFLSIANGSTCELETQILLSARLKFIKNEQVKNILNLCNEVKKMNFSLQRSL